MMMFNYNKKNDQVFNDIVDEILFFVDARIEGKEVENGADRMYKLNEAIARYATEGSSRLAARFEADGLSIMRDPMVNRNRDVREAYNVVIAEVVNVVVPTVASKAYSRYLAEVRQVGWGDTATFVVRSNELFQVNEIAEGINRGVLQPIYDTEITVNTKNTEIATSIDWYPVAAGVFDWGDFGYRAGRSYEGYIMLKIIAAMTGATSSLGAAYSVAGIDTENWTNIVDRVSSANGGAAVYGIGTLAALNKVMPSAVGLQYGLGEEMAKEGSLDRYLGVRLIPIDQVTVPGTINTTAKLAIPTNMIYIVAGDMYKPVKIVVEGNAVVLEDDATETADKTYNIRIQVRLGVSAICGSKFGTITLS